MSRATLAAVAVVSAAILAYEVLLMRLFSIVSWHHFAYMIISIALLGFGASGTVAGARATAAAGTLRRRFCRLRYSVCHYGGRQLRSGDTAPFNPLAIVWDAQQLIWLALSYALLVLPFFFGGGAIGLAFSRYSSAIGSLYAFDLIGAGIGALGVIGVLFLLSPSAALRVIAALGLLAASLVFLPAAASRHSRLAAAALTVAAIVVALWLPSSLIALHPHVSQYKGLPVALRVPAARIIDERSSPLGLISVVESPTIPFRHAPGLSLNNTVELPLQLGVFTDAESISTITQFNGDLERLRYLDFTTLALPYHLVQDPKVLILGAGGGEQVLLALYHRVPEIDAVELNRQIVNLVANEYAEFAGNIYNRPEVDVHVGDARSFIQRADKHYDLIQIPLLHSFGAAAAGTQSLHENYTYTRKRSETISTACSRAGSCQSRFG